MSYGAIISMIGGLANTVASSLPKVSKTYNEDRITAIGDMRNAGEITGLYAGNATTVSRRRAMEESETAKVLGAVGTAAIAIGGMSENAGAKASSTPQQLMSNNEFIQSGEVIDSGSLFDGTIV